MSVRRVAGLGLLAGSALLVARSIQAAPHEPVPSQAPAPRPLFELPPMNASQINFVRDITYFKRHEFLPDELLDLDANVIYVIDSLRERFGYSLVPSRLPGAIARHDDAAEYSRHYAEGRLSDAIDITSPTGNLFELYQAAKSIPEIGAVGTYPYWNTPGIHIDLRPRKGDGTIAEWMDKGVRDYVAINETVLRSV